MYAPHFVLTLALFLTINVNKYKQWNSEKKEVKKSVWSRQPDAAAPVCQGLVQHFLSYFYKIKIKVFNN